MAPDREVDADEGEGGQKEKKDKKGKASLHAHRTAKLLPLNIRATLVKVEELCSNCANLDCAECHEQFQKCMAVCDRDSKSHLEIQLEESHAKRALIELEKRIVRRRGARH